jgi:hypothetical protein
MAFEAISPLSYVVVVVFTIAISAYLFTRETDNESDEIFEYEEELLKQPRKGGNVNDKK